MPLSFPNRSRSYDSTRRAVRFWGHDSAMEASFFVTEDALKRVQPDMRFDEPGLLGAFDVGWLALAAETALHAGRGLSELLVTRPLCPGSDMPTGIERGVASGYQF